MKQPKQLIVGIILGGLLGPVIITCGSDVSRRMVRGGGQILADAGALLNDAGRTLLEDAGHALMDGGEISQDAGQRLQDASQAMGDTGLIRDAQAQTSNGGAFCYVSWADSTNSLTCATDFTEVYTGYAVIPFLGHLSSTGMTHYGYIDPQGSNGPMMASIGSPICANVNYANLENMHSESRISFSIGSKARSSLRCRLCCK